MHTDISEKYHLLKDFRLANPHSFLGLQESCIRLWRPEATAVHIQIFDEKIALQEIQPGLFEYHLKQKIKPTDYKVFHPTGLFDFDPYNFSPTFSEIDAELFEKGIHYELYEVMGAHIYTHENVMGVKFAIWAKNALSVCLIAEYNTWQRAYQPMRKISDLGIWEIFVPGIHSGEKYKFFITQSDGKQHIKSDPFGFFHELRPKTASIVFDIDHYLWHEDSHTQTNLKKPMNIYEVHLGSWKQKGAEFLNYRDLAHDLCDYCKKMGYTHVELLPIMEHPLDESWGYQVTGFFSPTSRYGTPEDFQYFVDFLHQNQIGVFLDWVPGHFPTDEFSLGKFDGTPIYEYSDPVKGFHPQWNTHIFDYKSPRVCNFLIANALFWFEKMHIDGLRVDAVSSLLYLDFARKPGDWKPNVQGGRENLEAIEFIRRLNRVVHQHHPHTLMMAEEATAFPKVTSPVDEGGLGFDLKWNMGWMNDTLRFFGTKPEFRDHVMRLITFSFSYVFSEKYMNVLSHDEVVHEKRSLLEKMPGNSLEQFANLRQLFCYSLTLPGKNLLFMGGEIGQRKEWDVKGQINWDLLMDPIHQSFHRFVQDLNHFYLAHAELWELDFDAEGYSWIDQGQCQISFLRKSKKSNLLCVHYFQASEIEYTIPISQVSSIREIFTTDQKEYGGTGCKNDIIRVGIDNVVIKMAPFSCAFFQVIFKDT